MSRLAAVVLTLLIAATTVGELLAESGDKQQPTKAQNAPAPSPDGKVAPDIEILLPSVKEALRRVGCHSDAAGDSAVRLQNGIDRAADRGGAQQRPPELRLVTATPVQVTAWLSWMARHTRRLCEPTDDAIDRPGGREAARAKKPKAKEARPSTVQVKPAVPRGKTAEPVADASGPPAKGEASSFSSTMCRWRAKGGGVTHDCEPR